MLKKEKTRDRIEEDLQVVLAMATSLSSYLDSTAVYYPLATVTYPKLTLGNYLMRQSRLLAVQDDLDDIKKGKLETAVFKFKQASSSRSGRVGQKGHEEAGIRLRQWQRAVQELLERPEVAIPYYATAVENRLMLAELITYLQQEPFQIDEQLLLDTAVIDQKLNLIWQTGGFVLPEVWQAAYPPTTHWWLYGQPTAPMAPE
jgi:hypothetical protein